MGYFDDMKVMLGRGMNAADRKTQELRLQAELSRVGSSLESAYAALGKVVYAHPSLAARVQDECPGEYGSITSLLKSEQDIRSKIEELQRQAAAVNTSRQRHHVQLSCPSCGMPVTLDLSYCPSCGDNLSELKQGYRMCPKCGTYHTADSMFCMQCGSRTVEVPVAPEASASEQEYQQDADIDYPIGQTAPANQAVDGGDVPISFVDDVVDSDYAAETAGVEYQAPQAEETHRCPSCGAEVAADDAFCGECGTRLNG